MSKNLTAKAGRPKSAAKRVQILQSAGKLFLISGFGGCSMEMVAQDSGVSKQTVYSHFNNKEALFIAVIEQKCSEYQLDEINIQSSTDDFIAVLRETGLQIIKLFHDPQVIAIYRVVIAEAASNPRVAELFYQTGPRHSLDVLAKGFFHSCGPQMTAKLADKCAVTFFDLLKSEFHVKSTLGLEFELSEAQQRAQVEFAVTLIQVLINK
jgi:TetR/AcrR family transcriptional repressor of mexJK operon